MRLPAHVSAAAVRRVVCHACAEPFEVPAVEEVEALETEPAEEPARRQAVVAQLIPAAPGMSLPRLRVPRLSAPSLPSLPKLSAPSLPGWLRDPSGRAWRLASIPVAAVGRDRGASPDPGRLG